MCPIKTLLAVLLATAGLFLAPAVLPLPSDRDQPIEVEADSAELDEGAGKSVYQGNVIVRQGTIRLEADRVTVLHRGRRPSKVIAIGNPVKFRQRPGGEDKEIRGSADRTEYQIDSEELLLIGNAFLAQGDDSFRSDRIVYDRVAERIKAGAAARGKERVKMTIGAPTKKTQ
jgi:lipopolysaccharide export system protein LptA